MYDKYENSWNSLMQQSRFPWWEWNIKKNDVIFNELKASILGYNPHDFAGKGYQGFTDLLHPEDYPKSMDAMRAVLEGRTNLYQIDYRIKNSAGSWQWYMDRGIIIEKDGNGTPVVIRGLVIDLGEEARRGTNIEALRSVIYSSAETNKGRTSFITLCSSCLKVKKGRNTWVELPEDITVFLSETVSHSICPYCIADLYPDLAEELLEEMEY